jgi:hypothetical protein
MNVERGFGFTATQAHGIMAFRRMHPAEGHTRDPHITLVDGISPRRGLGREYSYRSLAFDVGTHLDTLTLQGFFF